MENDNRLSITFAMYRPDEKMQKLMNMAIRYGKFEKAMDIARILHKMSLSNEEIMRITGLDNDDVEWAGQFDE